MKDNVDKLFQERFSGHEVPVDPALWAAIEGQLLVSAATTDPVNELFRERFQGHELPVDPAVWDGIGRQLGHAPPPASTSAWTWAASAAAVVVVGAGLWWSTTEAPSPVAEQRSAPGAVEVPSTQAPAEQPIAATPATVPVAPAVAPVAEPNASTASTVNRPTAQAIQPSGASPSVTLPADVQHVPAAPTTAPAPLGTGQPPAPPAPEQGSVNTPVADPQRVEAIIQQITERTKTEALANEVKEPETLAEQPVERAEEALELFMPNTFTPNGDGVNDTYELSMEGYQRMSVRVLSLKTDKLVFSTMTGEPWTGAGCEDGMYVVVVEAVAEDGRSLSKAKVVWLTRERMN